jgi:hypothetical protein
MAKQITVTLRDYVYNQIFSDDITVSNKSARIEELLAKGLNAEKNENKE